jgi:hypothetical protein
MTIWNLRVGEGTESLCSKSCVGTKLFIFHFSSQTSDDIWTINANFEIDPDKNGGLKFQYEAVERNPEERKRMHAGDCECCRDVSNSQINVQSVLMICEVL